MKSKLDALIHKLDALQGRPALDDLAEYVRQAELTPEDLAGFVHFADRHYRRNLVRAGRWYHLWVMCWRNGQRSPIHDHTGSACAVRVLRGTACITTFQRAPNGHIKAVRSEDLPAGSICATQDDDIHQVSNLQAGNVDLITLHVYSPPLLRMATYSLTEAGRGEEVWMEEQRRFITTGPENSETPLDSVHGWVTPNRLFFVRNHFPTPDLHPSTWKLCVGGLVHRPLELTWEELGQLPQRSVFATVECAGNGRSFLLQKQPGVQWGAGAIGHAEWTGVPLRLVLEKAGLKPGALEVLFQGADRGSEADHPEPMHFARSLPLDKAFDPDTLLATRMNGELLSVSHGAPVRLFVPGWYGVASVKWLTRIDVLDTPFRGYYQSTKYTVQRRTPSGPETVVVGPMAVKSEVIRPAADSELGVGTNRVFGTAWAGEAPVASVEVSTDGGSTWNQAVLLGAPARYSWTHWEYLWEVAEPGPYTLLARAVAEDGRVQPAEHDPLHGGYLIHHSRPVPVRVLPSAATAAAPTDLDTLLYDMNAYAEENARVPLDVELAFTGGAGI